MAPRKIYNALGSNIDSARARAISNEYYRRKRLAGKKKGRKR